MSAPIPTGGHRSKAARLVAETLAQPGPSRALALLCLSQAEGHCGRAARLFIAQVGPKRHCAQGAVYSRSAVAQAMRQLASNASKLDIAPQKDIMLVQKEMKICKHY